MLEFLTLLLFKFFSIVSSLYNLQRVDNLESYLLVVLKVYLRPYAKSRITCIARVLAENSVSKVVLSRVAYRLSSGPVCWLTVCFK